MIYHTTMKIFTDSIGKRCVTRAMIPWPAYDLSSDKRYETMAIRAAAISTVTAAAAIAKPAYAVRELATDKI